MFEAGLQHHWWTLVFSCSVPIRCSLPSPFPGRCPAKMHAGRQGSGLAEPHRRRLVFEISGRHGEGRLARGILAEGVPEEVTAGEGVTASPEVYVGRASPLLQVGAPFLTIRWRVSEVHMVPRGPSHQPGFLPLADAARTFPAAAFPAAPRSGCSTGSFPGHPRLSGEGAGAIVPRELPAVVLLRDPLASGLGRPRCPGCLASTRPEGKLCWKGLLVLLQRLCQLLCVRWLLALN